MTRVLVLLKTLGVGGAETLVLNSVKFWNRRDFHYQLGYLGGPADLREEFIRAGVEPVRFSPSGSANDPLAVATLARFLRRDKTGVIHAHLPLPAFWAATAAKRTRCAVVATSHCEPDGMRRATALLAQRAWPMADAVVAVGERVAASIRGARRVEVIPNGVDVSAFDVPPAEIAGLPTEAPVVLFLGTLAPPKRPLETLRVFEDADATAPGSGAHFVFAGVGPLFEALKGLSTSSPLRGRLHILGQRRDIPSLAARADAVCLLSVNEGLPMALLEGAAGRAALIGAQSSSATGTLIEDGVTGFTVASDGEAVRRLAELLKDRNLCRSLGEAARRRVEERYSLEQNIRQLEKIYGEVSR